MIISLVQLKGGSGKTTLSLDICAALATKRSKVLLVDGDPQGSVMDWQAVRQAAPVFTCIKMDRATLHKEIPAIAEGFEHVVIDTPPRLGDVVRSALVVSNIAVMPCQPSPLDVWSLGDTVKLVTTAKGVNPNLKPVICINRKVVGTALGRDVAGLLEGYGVPVLKSSICQRIAFAESLANGLTVIETEPNGPAAQEVAALVKELKGL